MKSGRGVRAGIALGQYQFLLSGIDPGQHQFLLPGIDPGRCGTSVAHQLPVSGTVPVPWLLLQAVNTAAAPALRLLENTLLEQ